MCVQMLCIACVLYKVSTKSLYGACMLREQSIFMHGVLELTLQLIGWSDGRRTRPPHNPFLYPLNTHTHACSSTHAHTHLSCPVLLQNCCQTVTFAPYGQQIEKCDKSGLQHASMHCQTSSASVPSVAFMTLHCTLLLMHRLSPLYSALMPCLVILSPKASRTHLTQYISGTGTGAESF